MKNTIKIIHGLPKGCEAAAAELYWQAFGDKLGKLLGPAPRGIDFFTKTINSPNILAALSVDGTLLGVSAIQINGHGFSRAGFRALFRHYGLSALWRIIPLAMMDRQPPPNTLQMDGICVSAEARGMGVGSALLTKVIEIAGKNQYDHITLDVIDTNPRAKALYERIGFVAKSIEKTSILEPLLGFHSATRMVKDVSIQNTN